MFSKRIAASCLMASIAITPATQVAAGSDGLVGGIVGGIIGGAIVNGATNHRKSRTKVVRQKPRVSSSVRQERREVQTSLNYFGFDAGVPDGVLGRRSRSAISQYQAHLGYPPTGTLTPYEKTILFGAYHRAISGGPEVSRIVNKLGVRAVLIAQRDGMNGTTTRQTTGNGGLPFEVSKAVDEIADSSDPSAEQLLHRSGFIQMADLNGDGNNDYILNTGFSGSNFWCNSAQCKTIVFASTSQGYARNDLLAHDPTPAKFECIGGSCQVRAQTALAQVEPAPVQKPETQLASVTTESTSQTALPVFNTGAAQKSLSSYCSKVSLLTNANGGYTTVSTLADPEFALSEQFCLARTYAIAGGEELMASVSGATSAQIDAQCDAFGKTLQPYVAALSLKEPAEVLRDVGSFILDSGMSPEQMDVTSRICLASGYKRDNLETALGATLLLTTLGNRPYAELLGHHLASGYGSAERHDMALKWYDIALTSLENGATRVFAPQHDERISLLRQASFDLSGAQSADAIPQAEDEASIPVFTLSE